MERGPHVGRRPRKARLTRIVTRAPLLATAILALAWAVWLGLLRIGWALPLPFPDQLILHGPLMIGGFLGTLIGLERAIGLHARWAYAAPVCSAAGSILLVAGAPSAGATLITIASGAVALVFVVILSRQPTLFAATMLLGTLMWLAGNIGWYFGASIYRVVFAWMTFVVLTIAGERLELTRVLRHGAAVQTVFVVAIAALLLGTAVETVQPSLGVRIIGAALAVIAWWLLQHDVARRTVRQHGATKFIAVCLLTGYVWLMVAGVLALLLGPTTPGLPYDATLHAVFLGFVVAMIFGHAPIVFPAVLGRPLPFDRAFYVHLATLHGSVALRLGGDLVDALAGYRSWGGLLNALAFLLFIVNNVRAMLLPSTQEEPR